MSPQFLIRREHSRGNDAPKCVFSIYKKKKDDDFLSQVRVPESLSQNFRLSRNPDEKENVTPDQNQLLADQSLETVHQQTQYLPGTCQYTSP